MSSWTSLLTPTYSSSSCAFSRTSASSFMTHGGRTSSPTTPGLRRPCPAPTPPLATPPVAARRADDRAKQTGLHARVPAHHHVFDRAHGREEADVLERARHAHGRDLIRAPARDVLAVEDQLPGRGLVEAGEDVEEGRLARAVR